MVAEAAAGEPLGMPKKNLAARAGSWSARHKKKAIFGWLAFVVIALAIGGSVGTKSLEDTEAGTGDSRAADRILDKSFDQSADEQVLVQARDGKVRAAAVADVKRAVAKFDDAKLGKDTVSADGRSVLVNFEIPGDDDDKLAEQVAPIETAIAGVQRKHPGARVGQFGDASADRALSDRFDDDFAKAETLSLPVTLIILVVAFGALVAAGLPVLLAVTGVGSAIGLLALPSQLMPVDDATASVILLIGMAVGVDYALFYLRREREEREKGASTLEAIDIAAATSGRAVLVSGMTVMVAMAGMYLTGSPVFQGMATGTILVVAAAMLGSITFVPAMLALLGHRIDKGRIPFLHRLKRKDGESRLWNAILTPVLKRPLVAAVASTALLVGLAIPALGLNTANSGMTDLPRDMAIMQTYDRMQAAFPGGEIPAEVVVRGEGVAKIGELQDATKAWGESDVTLSPDRSVAMVSIPMPGDGTDDRSDRALEELRNEILPRTVGDDALVTGMTAESKDFNDLMTSKAPLVFAFVLALAFMLLLVTFRSIVIPIKAIVLNLLSVGAAYGVLVLVFQHGWGAGLLGVDEASQGFITAWLPMFLFVILFGLSMDYHVFILSRIREAFDGGMSTEDAVAHGIKTTAGVVTSAAVVMIAVFAIFGTLTFIDMKQMGVGLAAAILIDATIVRAVLLPAAMKLLGDANWYLPSWLGWLPKLELESPGRQPEPAGATA
jgi:RND superfamily putative drug exporter